MSVFRLIAVALLLGLFSIRAHAFPGLLTDWQARYGADSDTGTNAGCQLCHGDANGGSLWNAYGWSLRVAFDQAACDLSGDGTVGSDEAFACIEFLNSDEDAGENDNFAEIAASTQPGWSNGACNELFSDAGVTPGQAAPVSIGALDPPGTPPRTGCDDVDPDPTGPPNSIVLVKTGESIQAAIDSVGENSTILIEPGIYHETGNAMNALNVTKSGLRLIGLGDTDDPVVLENAGSQSNGIVVVPQNRTNCLGCHTTLAPPFTLAEGVDPTPSPMTPVIHGFEIRNVTIRNFVNNGLFTERVDDFKIINVNSVDNTNYGIFPTLSSNGVVQHCTASGADDSGIWIETSVNVRVADNVAFGNVNGFEFSNSDYVTIENNEAYGNTVGIALFVLPELVDERPSSNKWLVRNNYIHDNNKPNTATPGSILAFLPSGFGILQLGVDNSVIRDNVIENNDFFGLAMVDYCLALIGTDFDCSVNVPPAGFDPVPRKNRVVDNEFIGNGTNPDLASPFFFAAADITQFIVGDVGNCYSGNSFSTVFTLGPMPACPGPIRPGLSPMQPIVDPSQPFDPGSGRRP